MKCRRTGGTGITIVKEWTQGRKLWLEVDHYQAEEVGLEIIEWCVREYEAEVMPENWRRGGIEINTVRVGIGGLEFGLYADYENLYITRVSGNNRAFTEICERIRDEFVSA